MSDEWIRSRIADALRTARTRRGLRQREVAEMCDIGEKMYGAMERGKKACSVGVLHRVARVLSLDLNSIFRVGNDDIKHASPTARAICRSVVDADTDGDIAMLHAVTSVLSLRIHGNTGSNVR